jgi:hypothetical protein
MPRREPSDTSDESSQSDHDHSQDVGDAVEFPPTAAPMPQSGASTVVFQQVRHLFSP